MRRKVRNPNENRYCWTCGAKVKRVFTTYAYEMETGEAKQYEERECPNQPKTFFQKVFTYHRVERPIPNIY